MDTKNLRYYIEAIGELNPRELDILIRRYTVPTWSLEKLSRKYGVTRQRIGQIEVQAYTKIFKYIKKIK